MVIEILKNRFNDSMSVPRFLVGIDRPKMRLFDIQERRLQHDEDLELDPEFVEDTKPMTAHKKLVLELANKRR
jgi:hypothetical protein